MPFRLEIPKAEVILKSEGPLPDSRVFSKRRYLFSGKKGWGVSPKYKGKKMDLCFPLEKQMPSSISTCTQYNHSRQTVKMCRFSSGNWFFCTNSCSLPWLVKGATLLCTSKKE
jgi:hypothetical protein